MAEQSVSAETNKDALSEIEEIDRPVNRIVAGVGLAIVIGVIAAVYFAFAFVEDERQRALNDWQIKLGIVADTRTAALNDWVEENFSVMREISDNASLQLYMTELEMFEGDTSAVTDEAAQATYLRNMLVAIADRNGFAAPYEAPEVSANIERIGIAGIGLADASGLPIVSTPGMPPIGGKIKEAVLKALGGEPVVIDLYIGPSGKPTMGFALPVYGIQDMDAAEGIGAVVGIKVIDQGLYDVLEQPGEISATADTYIVREANNQVEYLSPLIDGTPAMDRSMAVNTENLAAAFAVQTPGGFATKRNYAGNEVLVTSRSLKSVPWVLVRSIPYSDALEETETRLRTILIVFVLIIGAVIVALIAVWRHGSSMRATQAAQNFKVSSERFENLSKFMNLISNSQPTGICAVDGNTVYTYANGPAAQEGGITPQDMLGKTMASVLGPIKATAYADINEKILNRFIAEGQDDPEPYREQHINTFGEGDDIQVVKSDHTPLHGDRDHPPGVLMILDDITELTRERRRSEKMLRQLINTLVSVVDRRDPFSANHSFRVAEVAKAIAEEMARTELEAKTVDIAGSLMNLGKIFIPPALLTKTGDLTPEERSIVTNSYLVSVDLLSDVTFEGQVVDTIREMGETWDGNGPLGKQGDDILLSSRILAVANTFVGMISPRAYREAMTFEKVSNILLEMTGSKFDRKPVSALINFLENRGGKEKWSHYREKPGATEE